MTKKNKIIQKLAEELLSNLQLTGKVEIDESNEVVVVNFDVEESGMLIGYHGENIEAVRTLLGQMAHKELDEWVKLDINVGDYLQKREEKLKIMADRAVQRVLETKQSETLPFLNSKERRVVHVYLEDQKEVKTESVGEDDQRRLVVFPA